jgi:hypothetical protein
MNAAPRIPRDAISCVCFGKTRTGFPALTFHNSRLERMFATAASHDTIGSPDEAKRLRLQDCKRERRSRPEG